MLLEMAFVKAPEINVVSCRQNEAFLKASCAFSSARAMTGRDFLNPNFSW
jgi:hypothetical protein